MALDYCQSCGLHVVDPGPKHVCRCGGRSFARTLPRIRGMRVVDASAPQSDEAHDTLLALYERKQRTEQLRDLSKRDRERGSELWSQKLREKIRASEAEQERRDRMRVVIDPTCVAVDWLDWLPWRS